MGGFNIGGGPSGQAAPGALPGSSTLSGVLASVSTIDLNSGAFQPLSTVPAGRTMIVDYVILRDPTHASAANIDGTLGTAGTPAGWASFPVQTSLNAAGKMSTIYPSAIGESATYAAASVFGITLTTLGGVAGKKMTVEVIGRLI